MGSVELARVGPPSPPARLRALAAPAWVLLLTAAVQVFFFQDWGQGVVRGGLLAFLALATLGAARTGLPGWLAASARPRWLDALALALVGVHAAIALFVAGESIGLLYSEGREGEMGATNHRALQLVAQGVSPYTSRALLDEVRYRLLVTDPLAGSCFQPAGEVALAAFEAWWRSGDAALMPAAWPRVVGPREACRELEAQTRFLGLKYGPVLLASYAPWVAVLGKAGIRVSHAAWLLGLCLLLVGRARRWGGFGGFELTLALWPLLVPNLVRFDFLRHTDCDLAPTLLGVLAFALLEDRRPGWAGAAVGLSVGAKLLPGLLLVPLLLPAWRRSLPAFGGALLLSFGLPLAGDAGGLVDNVLRFSLQRPADSTSLAAFLPEAWRGVLAAAGALAIGLMALALLTSGSGRRARLGYLLGSHLALLFAAKLFHNNYLVWLLPWLGLWLADRLIAHPAVAGASMTPGVLDPRAGDGHP